MSTEHTQTVDELRDLLEQQRGMIEQQQKQIKSLKSTVEDLKPISPERRALLKAAGLAGAGGIAIGAGARMTLGEALAQPSTTDGDGDLGDPNDRWDLFADGVDANVVSTESLLIDQLTDGSTNRLIDADETDEATQYFAEAIAHREKGIAQTATTIYSVRSLAVGEHGGGLITVNGRDQSSGSNFSDVVHISRAETPQVINSVEASTPSARNYTVDGADVQLDMASGTYNVIVVGSYATTEN